MKRVERDFVSLFNCLWYQDFPVREGQYVNRANWTIHIGLVIRQCANLLGAKAYFEQGNRTDAVMKYPDDQILSNVEWEWISAYKPKVNELDKLKEKWEEPFFSTFISYSQKEHVQTVIQRASKIWGDSDKALIFFLITFHTEKGHRAFDELQTHVFVRGRHKRIRKQPALPWNIVRSKFNEAVDADIG